MVRRHEAESLFLTASRVDEVIDFIPCLLRHIFVSKLILVNIYTKILIVLPHPHDLDASEFFVM